MNNSLDPLYNTNIEVNYTTDKEYRAQFLRAFCVVCDVNSKDDEEEEEEQYATALDKNSDKISKTLNFIFEKTKNISIFVRLYNFAIAKIFNQKPADDGGLDDDQQKTQDVDGENQKSQVVDEEEFAHNQQKTQVVDEGEFAHNQQKTQVVDGGLGGLAPLLDLGMTYLFSFEFFAHFHKCLVKFINTETLEENNEFVQKIFNDEMVL
jgi:hypothetical protein